MKKYAKIIARIVIALAAVLLVTFGNEISAKADTISGDNEITIDGVDNPYAAIFNPEFYANKYSDVKAAFGNNQQLLLQHFLQCGVIEGRQGCEDFDPKTYRMRYSDLNAVYGDNMKMYYVHYLQIGKAEGRSGKPAGNSQVINNTNDVATNQNNPYANAYNIMTSFKNSYPEGMRYTNDDFYRWKGGIYYGGYGCAGFAFMLSDAVFGNNKAEIHYDINSIRVGDILRINNDSHSVIVLEVNEEGVVLAEGNYNSSVHWGRTMSWNELTRTVDYVMTRY